VRREWSNIVDGTPATAMECRDGRLRSGTVPILRTRKMGLSPSRYASGAASSSVCSGQAFQVTNKLVVFDSIRCGCYTGHGRLRCSMRSRKMQLLPDNGA